MLAKPLKWVDHPYQIVIGIEERGRYGKTVYSKRTQKMKASRRENRELPRVYRPRKKVVDVQSETATCVVASIEMVRSLG